MTVDRVRRWWRELREPKDETTRTRAEREAADLRSVRDRNRGDADHAAAAGQADITIGTGGS